MHQHCFGSIGGESIENRADFFGRSGGKGHCAGLEEIVQGPAADDAVVRRYHQRNQYGKEAHSLPEALPSGQAGEGGVCIGAAAPAYHHLSHEYRQRDEQGCDDIHKNEYGPSVLPDHIGEPPDVAKADGRAGHSKDDSHTAAETFAFCRHSPLGTVIH